MSDHVSDWDLMALVENGAFQQSAPNREEDSMLPDSGYLHDQPTTWLPSPCSMSEGDNYSDIFKVLSNVQLQASPTTLQASTTSSFQSEKGESSRAKRKYGELEYRQTQSEKTARVAEPKRNQDDKRPRRTRSAETHNRSEKMRRDRIREKMRTLQELIPNSYKANRASMLDETIEYIKSLKHQLQVMSTVGGILCQAPYMSWPPYQSIRMPNFPPSVGMGLRMGFGMGMHGMSCSTGLPMFPDPSSSLHPSPSPSPATGFLLFDGSGVLPVPHLQVPCINPSPAAYSSTFNSSNQGDSASQTIPRISTDFQHMPMISQESKPSSSFGKMPASGTVRPSSSGNVAAEGPQFDKEAELIQDTANRMILSP